MIKKLKSDRLLLQSIVAVLILSLCHWIQFVRSGYSQPLIRAVCASVYIISALIFGRKCWSVILLVWALAILYFNRFCNYTSFIMILIAINTNKKLLVPYILLYISCVFACLFIYHDSFTHLIIHALGCYFFYIVYLMILDKFKVKKVKLNLTEDEENIIKQLVEGVELKAIDGYSQNTIFTKLRDARERNGLKRNCQLVELYAEEIETK